MVKSSLARPTALMQKTGADVDRKRRRPTTGYRGIELTKSETKDRMKPRERLLGAAYELFATKGIGQVGIDTILTKSGCAKASLYSNFDSKVDLAIAFLDRRETVWTRGWLETEIEVTHELATDHEASTHAGGWSQLLGRLQAYVEGT